MYFTDFEKNIIKTFAYYQALGNMPLTLVEIKKYFLGSEFAPLFNIQTTLNNLKTKEILKEKNGLWYINIKECTENISDRLANSRNTLLKWKMAKNKTKFLAYMPYIKEISIAGSVALNNSKEQSDIDIIVTSKKDRIWTTRFLVTFLAFILKRRRNKKHNSNRLCIHQYITENSNSLGPENINKIIQDIKTNIWLEKENLENNTLFAINPSKISLSIKKCLEYLLELTLIGHFAEILLANLQIVKIKHNPIEYPSEMPAPKLRSENLIFYYPQVRATESRYIEILNHIA